MTGPKIGDVVISTSDNVEENAVGIVRYINQGFKGSYFALERFDGKPGGFAIPGQGHKPKLWWVPNASYKLLLEHDFQAYIRYKIQGKIP